MNSDWNEIVIELQTKDLPRGQELASQCSDLGLYIEDYSDMEQMLPLIGGADYISAELSAKNRSRCAIHIYLPSNEPPKPVIEKLQELLRSDKIGFTLKTDALADADWGSDWKKFHKPQKIGNRLVICPSWESYHSEADEVILTLDPGSAFGSGEDETTKVCLRLLEENLKVGDRILDLGCGSGVLAIAALLLGAKSALGVDIDPAAVKTAAINASLNGVGRGFTGAFGNLLSDPGLSANVGGDFDLICANIVADVHILMCGLLFEKLKSGGKFVISGIIQDRREEVRTAMEQAGFLYESTAQENGWVGFSFKKPGTC